MPKKKQQIPENQRFSLDNLHDLKDKHGELTFDLICQKFEWYSRKYLSIKMAEKRRAGTLTYGKNYSDIRLLKPRSSQAVDTIKRNELGRLKTWFYVQELYELTEDLESGELKARERVKVHELRGKVLKNLTSSVAVDYARQFEEKMGIKLPWQDILD